MATEKRPIDANDLRAQFDDIPPFIGMTGGCVQQYIDKAPTLDVVQVVHGEWIRCQGKTNLWYCSACGEKIRYNPTRRVYNITKRPVHEANKFCRGCGAKMDGGYTDVKRNEN